MVHDCSDITWKQKKIWAHPSGEVRGHEPQGGVRYLKAVHCLGKKLPPRGREELRERDEVLIRVFDRTCSHRITNPAFLTEHYASPGETHFS